MDWCCLREGGGREEVEGGRTVEGGMERGREGEREVEGGGGG